MKTKSENYWGNYTISDEIPRNIENLRHELDSLDESLSKVITKIKFLNSELNSVRIKDLSNAVGLINTQFTNTGSTINLFVNGSLKNLRIGFDQTGKSVNSILPVMSSFISICASIVSILVNIRNSSEAAFLAITALGAAISRYTAIIAGVIAIYWSEYNIMKLLIDLTGSYIKAVKEEITVQEFAKRGYISVIQTVKDLTFGLVDLTAKTETMTDAAYGLGEAWIWTKKQIQNALDINKQKLLTSGEGQSVLFDKFLKGETLSIEELSAVESGLNKLRMETHDPELISKVNQYSDAVEKQRNKLENLGKTEKHVNNIRNNSYKNIDINDKQLSWLDELLKKQEHLKNEIKYFKDLSQDVNQETFVRLNAYEKLLEKQKELNALMKTELILPAPKTGEEFLNSLPDVKISERDKSGDAELQRHLETQREFAKRMQEIYDGMANGVVGSMGNLFASLVPPQAALSPLEQFMKQIVITFINAVQGLVLAAAAALPAKGITTFGISMITDAPLLAAAYAALEIAKGFVGGFAKGTDYLHKTGYALVGEQGPELVYLNRGAKVFNNNDTSKMLNSARGNMQANMNVNNVYISSSLDALTFFRVNYPKYKKFKTLQAV